MMFNPDAAKFKPGIGRKISQGGQRFQTKSVPGRRPHRFASSPRELTSEGRSRDAAAQRHSLLRVDDTQDSNFIDQARLCTCYRFVCMSVPFRAYVLARHTVRGCLEGVFVTCLVAPGKSRNAFPLFPMCSRICACPANDEHLGNDGERKVHESN